MRRRLLVLSIAAALAAPALAQQAEPAPAPAPAEGSVPMTWVGSNGRVSLGVDDDLNAVGEGLYVFGADGDSSWIVEGWVGNDGEGGLKLDYHWLWGGKTAQDAIDAPDTVTVAKGFLAVDQNPFDDRKATVGIGFEKNDLFLDTYVSGAITGRRFVDRLTDVDTRIITGSEGGRPFQQTETITTVTEIFEHPWDWGLGARFGRYFDSQLARVRAGIDYEDGENGADQFTLSVGLDKYIPNTGHSLSLEFEHYERSGPFETDAADRRAWLLWRYDFGQSFRPAQPTRPVQVERMIEVEVPGEPVVVRNEVRIESDALFEFDRAELRPGAQAALAELAGVIRSGKRVSRVAVTGHTCDLGPEAYNQGLSERRADAVRAFLAEQGVDVAELDVSGRGESAPRVPNDSPENRARNRRVDVSFLTVEERTEAGPPRREQRPVVDWSTEPVKVPAAWIERALRNPAEHKRTVDVYRIEETSSATELGPREFLNRGPEAVDDLLGGNQCLAEYVIPVLANDSDPDGDALTVVTAGAVPGAEVSIAGGTIVVRGGGPGSALCAAGGASFGYTIADPSGEQDSATVRIELTNAPPTAADDAATTGPGQPATIAVLANDADPDGDTLTVTEVGSPANGTATLGADGRVTYTPAAGFVGTDRFVYRVSDGRGGTAQATVTVSIANRPPLAVDDFTTGLGTLDTVIDVLANDSDPDGDPLTVVSITQPANGFAALNPDGTVTYRARRGFCGLDPFTYTIRDANGAEATATVTVDVLD